MEIFINLVTATEADVMKLLLFYVEAQLHASSPLSLYLSACLSDCLSWNTLSPEVVIPSNMKFSGKVGTINPTECSNWDLSSKELKGNSQTCKRGRKNILVGYWMNGLSFPNKQIGGVGRLKSSDPNKRSIFRRLTIKSTRNRDNISILIPIIELKISPYRHLLK